ncbi:methyltransferase domain-containing protein [candidate division FCPU426 bacterium]|nr:methyltransferase domain-containing protein [candidate division FCPU426 bacterium]
MFKERIPKPIRRWAQKCLFPLPSHLARRHRRIGQEGLLALEQSIRKNYHTGWRSQGRFSPAAYAQDLETHVCGRLEYYRRMIVPWLDQACSLHGKRILEIGCGTGSATVVLAEQGTKVTGIDVDEGALIVAKDRCRLYGVTAELQYLNAREIGGVFSSGEFDWIIFFACLEHMTVEERLHSLQSAWGLLPGGGLLAVVDTPNRLWYDDQHTARLPFFHWLPDPLAFQYARFSPRENFRELYQEDTPASLNHFLRRGRGVSFHEFDLALKPAGEPKVISSLSSFQGMRYALRQSRVARRYKSLLMQICPQRHEGFFNESLHLIMQKD